MIHCNVTPAARLRTADKARRRIRPVLPNAPKAAGLDRVGSHECVHTGSIVGAGLIRAALRGLKKSN
eukprot:SAG31_NODE_9726_length_1236_cov_2.160070_1_plen_66_part_10